MPTLKIAKKFKTDEKLKIKGFYKLPITEMIKEIVKVTTTEQRKKWDALTEAYNSTRGKAAGRARMTQMLADRATLAMWERPQPAPGPYGAEYDAKIQNFLRTDPMLQGNIAKNMRLRAERLGQFARDAVPDSEVIAGGTSAVPVPGTSAQNRVTALLKEGAKNPPKKKKKATPPSQSKKKATPPAEKVATRKEDEGSAVPGRIGLRPGETEGPSHFAILEGPVEGLRGGTLWYGGGGSRDAPPPTPARVKQIAANQRRLASRKRIKYMEQELLALRKLVAGRSDAPPTWEEQEKEGAPLERVLPKWRREGFRNQNRN